MTEPFDKLIDAAEVAELLGMSKAWVYRKTREGHLPSVLFPGSRVRRYRRSTVEAWIEAHENDGASK